MATAKKLDAINFKPKIHILKPHLKILKQSFSAKISHFEILRQSFMLKILHLKLQGGILRQILPRWIARLEFNFRRKILRLEFYLNPHATEIGKILARNFKLRNFVCPNFASAIKLLKIKAEFQALKFSIKTRATKLYTKFYIQKFYWRRKITSKFRGEILTQNFELQNSAWNSAPRNPREILPAKFTGKILWRICIPKFCEHYKICSEIRREISNYEIPRWISICKIQEKFHAKFDAAPAKVLIRAGALAVHHRLDRGVVRQLLAVDLLDLFPQFARGIFVALRT